MTLDRRLTPATDRIALDGLRGIILRPAYAPGKRVRLSVPLADLCRAPDGARDRQVNYGADLLLIDEQDGWAFVQAFADGYCGWVRGDTLSQQEPQITHRVSAPATHVYPEPDMKTRETASLSLGARLAVVATQNGYARLAQGGWVPAQHISDQHAVDPGAVAETLLGTPYLWGGNSRWGIDCSGLAQASLMACGIACPGDSDMQFSAFAPTDEIQRNDLLFWRGHVAIALDSTHMIHATANTMSVAIEPIANALARIKAADQGEYLGARRPIGAARAAFP